jgi:serine O-acetyltransferase
MWQPNWLKKLNQDLKIVFERDPSARNLFEVLTLYPGIHAVIFYRIAHWLWGIGLCWFARAIATLARWFTGIEIHPAAQIGRRFFIDHGMGVVIGETAIIGDDCMLYHGVTLGGTSWEQKKRHPTLLDGVIVGAGAKLLGAITLGKGVRVGCNAVVVDDVPEGATVVGIPARAIIKGHPSGKTAADPDSEANQEEWAAKLEDIVTDLGVLEGQVTGMSQRARALHHKLSEIAQAEKPPE